MPTLTGTGLAITIDVLIRVSVVLLASLLLALSARRNAALRHAILVAGLACAFIMPAAILIMQMLPVPRLPLDGLGWVGPEGPAAVAVVSSGPPSQPNPHLPIPERPGPEIVATRRDDTRLDSGHDASARSSLTALGPRAWSRWNLPARQWLAGGLLLVWLCGAIARLIGLSLSLMRLRRIVERARPVTCDQVLSILALIQQRIPMRCPPRLLESEDVSAPVAVGVIGNYVLLPSGWAGGLRDGEALAVLCHESAHLARSDHRVVVLQEFLASVLWFHPLVPLFHRILNRVREEVCDNYAIDVVDRVSYCEALLLLSVARPGASPRGATSMWTRHWSLEDRVRGILDERRPTKTEISGLARSATVMFSLSVCGLIAMPQLIASPASDRIARRTGTDASSGAKVGPTAKEMTRTIIKSFPVNGEEPLRFENLAGRIELVPAASPTVEVEAMVRVSDLPEGDAKRLINDIRWDETTTKDGQSRWGLVFPEGRYPIVRYAVSGESPSGVTTVSHLGRKIHLSDRPSPSIPAVEFDLRIAVPPQARVAIHNAIGPVGGEDLVAPLHVTTYAGSIQLRNVRGPVTASSELGPIMISNLESEASLHTGSGGIELARVRGRVSLTTRSGGCRIVQQRDTAFTLRNVGRRPVVVFTDGVRRSSPQSGDPHIELLSRGSGGAVFTVDSGAGDCVIESAP